MWSIVSERITILENIYLFAHRREKHIEGSRVHGKLFFIHLKSFPTISTFISTVPYHTSMNSLPTPTSVCMQAYTTLAMLSTTLFEAIVIPCVAVLV